MIKFKKWTIVTKYIEIHILTLTFYLVILYGLSIGVRRNYENRILAKEGNLIKALLTSKVFEANKGRMQGYYYTFNFNDETYVGHTFTQEGYNPGDSILVLYLERKPSINRDFIFIAERYDTKKIAPLNNK